jgi:glycosyltransferase involved in cell wall biosynthesis
MKGGNSATGDYIIMMDADLSHIPEEIPNMISKLQQGYDICMGSRFIGKGGTDDMPMVRKAGNLFFVKLVNVLYGSNYTDLCYGYRAFRRKAFRRLRLKSKGFSIETEISIKASKLRMSVIEIPSYEKKRGWGKGKLRTFSDGFKILYKIFNT